MTGWLARTARVAALATFATTTACGSDDGSGGGGPDGTDADVSCGIAITLSGASNLALDLEDAQGCVSSTTLGPYVAFVSPPSSDITVFELTMSALMPGQTATALPAGLTLDHEDGSEFTPTGCSVDVTENSLETMAEGESMYRVAGTGSCSEPGTSDTRSISVVGFFRFVATPGWQN